MAKSDDVAIVGIGITSFARQPDKTGMDHGVDAVRMAVADAGCTWNDMQFAFGGSAAAGAPDTMVSRLGLTGLQFINVANGCATGGSALFSAINSIKAGMYDLGIAVGFDKHEPGAFRVETKKGGLGEWYGDTGMALTTQFFGMKINRYMHDFAITNESLGKIGEKAFRNGSMNENAWRRQPMSEAQVKDSAMLSYPLTQYMFCSPGEGGVALVLCRADKAHKYNDNPIMLDAAVVRSRQFGSFEVFA
ncbi:MAG: acetyl-CoA C-acetyltransferase, partial [Acidimicrobiales bacterium]